jgi:hypothetical protein
MRLRHHRRHLRCQEFHDLETIHLPQLREWEFHARWHDLETIHSMPLKVWHALVHQDQVHQDQVHDQKVEHQDLEQGLQVQAELVQDLAEPSLDLVAVLPVEDSQAEDLPAVAVEELAEEPLVRLVKAALAVAEKLASQSVPREKNSNKEVFQALVAQLCHAGMEQQLFVCAAVHRFKTSQTRLMPMQVS